MNLRQQISADLLVAPFVFNALSAKLAEGAGFTATLSWGRWHRLLAKRANVPFFTGRAIVTNVPLHRRTAYQSR